MLVIHMYVKQGGQDGASLLNAWWVLIKTSTADERRTTAYAVRANHVHDIRCDISTELLMRWLNAV